MKKKEKTRLIAELTRLLDKGVIITTYLKIAIKSTIKAIEENDLELAYQLTACKSLISGWNCDKKICFFREDTEANRKKLGVSVYSKLDDIHHDLACIVGLLPSGMAMFSSDGTVHGMKSVGTHPIVKRIAFEKDRIDSKYNRG